KLATRTGNVVLLSELFDDAIKRVYAIIDAKNPQLANKDEVARKVGVGAVIFNQLSTGRIKDVNFVWEDALNFDGNTGPYVQYTYARSCSVLAKAGERLSSSLSWSLSREEKELLNLLVLFPQKVEQAKNECEPSVITRYILDICACYNRFYHNCPILKAEGDTKELRLRLCEAFKAIAGRALWLIGLEKTEAV
ncbi:MAG TPA: arginine--tRNA ligase, partial [Clostridiales bacterium]|nr:arginine--tRNA ligase [Clostridiales bacterium]